MANIRHEIGNLLRRNVHPAIAYLAIFTIGAAGSAEVVQAYDDKTDAEVFELDHQLDKLQARTLFSDYQQISQHMQRATRELTSSSVDVFCGIPDPDSPLTVGLHHRNPVNGASFITLNYLYCDALERAQDPSFEPGGPYQAKLQTSTATAGVFFLAHEAGHEENGSSERGANCYAATNFSRFAEALGMPQEIIDTPVSTSSC